MNILIVEDDASVRNLLRAFFNRLGHQVASVGSFRMARALLADNDHPVQLVTTSYRLADGTGLDVIILAATLTPKPQIWLITGSVDADLTPKAFEAGATAVIRKPMDFKTVNKLLMKMEPQGK